MFAHRKDILENSGVRYLDWAHQYGVEKKHLKVSPSHGGVQQDSDLLSPIHLS
jgi:hypothetical protein